MEGPTAREFVEGDISMIEALRSDLAGQSRRERRRLLRAIPAPWLRMAVAMPEDQWQDAKRLMLTTGAQFDLQLGDA